jgi:hypothetical protein
MDTPNLSSIVQLMRGAIDRMQREGRLTSRGDRVVQLREVFSFRPQDVAGISYIKNKEGMDSLHFRLRNGRVFDDHGQSSESEE